MSYPTRSQLPFHIVSKCVLCALALISLGGNLQAQTESVEPESARAESAESGALVEDESRPSSAIETARTSQQLASRSLKEFQFDSFENDLVPRNYFSEQRDLLQASATERITTAHQLYVEPPGLVHQRLYFEERLLERCGQVSCRPNQQFVSAAKFFYRGILFPLKVLRTDTCELQCTERNCPWNFQQFSE